MGGAQRGWQRSSTARAITGSGERCAKRSTLQYGVRLHSLLGLSWRGAHCPVGSSEDGTLKSLALFTRVRLLRQALLTQGSNEFFA